MSGAFYTPALLWDEAPAGAAHCRLCAQYCLIAEDAAGKCGVRKNLGGKLLTRCAGEVAAMNLDPVEKKPLYHFLPGSRTFSLGSFGCNFSCSFCQNNDISQYCHLWEHGGHAADPAGLVRAAQKRGAASISYTYNEPTVFFELMRPTASLAHERGLRNVMVSNAYLSRECFAELDGLIDAANFDLKSFSDAFYREYCGARLGPVLKTLERAVGAGWWVELTTLIIPGLNDSPEELDAITAYIKEHLGQDVPWHVSRFRPAYRMTDRPVTGMDSMERALEAGYKAGLHYVYAGNVPGHQAENTFCPSCKSLLISRQGYAAQSGFNGICPECSYKIAGFWRQ